MIPVVGGVVLWVDLPDERREAPRDEEPHENVKHDSLHALRAAAARERGK